jgi:hypothetical protein
VTVCAAKKDPLLRSGEVNIPVPDKETGKCDYSQVDVRGTYNSLSTYVCLFHSNLL